ncbi:hypothetical protein EYF80_033616 [Liparis tanakae]|uniref:Uncharacterized protein n=1 Tax=Liparis tanakae TaxID=230148 RepID=A0A4Z2GS72_9TELE|nr:hypothetical protein EYF80_033616 [Liparis tanakae]
MEGRLGQDDVDVGLAGEKLKGQESAMNTRDSTDTVTDAHWMNGTSRHSSDPNTQWSISV